MLLDPVWIQMDPNWVPKLAMRIIFGNPTLIILSKLYSASMSARA